MRTALSQLSQYLQRYKSRLLGKNIVYIKQIIMVIKAMIKFLEGAVQHNKTSNKNNKERILNINEFVHDLGIDHLNMFKIEKYLKESKLARKLNGFLDMKNKKDAQDKLTHPQNETENEPPTSSIPILNQIEALLMALTNADQDGRIIVSSENGDEYIQYMLLNPANEFKAIVEESRSVVLAGGTMEPVSLVKGDSSLYNALTRNPASLQMSDFLTHLFPYIEKDRIHKFSCGHIIPKENLQVLTVGTGPTGQKLIYNFEHRSDTKLVGREYRIKNLRRTKYLYSYSFSWCRLIKQDKS